MRWNRIRTILLESGYHMRYSMETWVDIFWMGAIQIAVNSFIARFFSSFGSSKAGLFLLIGTIFWNILWGGQYAVAVGMLWEVWAKNLTSLFISPLTIEEYLIAQVISGLAKTTISFLLASLIAYLIFGFSIFSLGPIVLVYAVALFLFSCSLGMIVLSVILRFGMDVQSLSWSIIYLVQPLGGVFYPLSVLPPGFRSVAALFPTSYIFEAIRQQVQTGQINTVGIAWGYGMTGLYLIGGYILLRLVYANARKTGSLARMEG